MTASPPSEIPRTTPIRAKTLSWAPAVNSSASITASGGTGPYTYSWTLVTGMANLGISNSVGSSVTWSWNGAKRIGVVSSTWQCVVSDSAGHSVVAGTVAAVLLLVQSQRAGEFGGCD